MVGLRNDFDDSLLQPSGSSLLSHQGIDTFKRLLGADASPGLAGFAARGMAVVGHLRMALGVEAVAKGDITHLAVVGVAGQSVALLLAGVLDSIG